MKVIIYGIVVCLYAKCPNSCAKIAIISSSDKVNSPSVTQIVFLPTANAFGDLSLTILRLIDFTIVGVSLRGWLNTTSSKGINRILISLRLILLAPARAARKNSPTGERLIATVSK